MEERPAAEQDRWECGGVVCYTMLCYATLCFALLRVEKGEFGRVENVGGWGERERQKTNRERGREMIEGLPSNRNSVGQVNR